MAMNLQRLNGWLGLTTGGCGRGGLTGGAILKDFCSSRGFNFNIFYQTYDLINDDERVLQGK